MSNPKGTTERPSKAERFLSRLICNHLPMLKMPATSSMKMKELGIQSDVRYTLLRDKSGIEINFTESDKQIHLYPPDPLVPNVYNWWHTLDYGYRNIVTQVLPEDFIDICMVLDQHTYNLIFGGSIGGSARTITSRLEYINFLNTLTTVKNVVFDPDHLESNKISCRFIGEGDYFTTCFDFVKDGRTHFPPLREVMVERAKTISWTPKWKTGFVASQIETVQDNNQLLKELIARVRQS